MFAASLLLLLLSRLQDVDYFLSLWHGRKAAEFDVDAQGLGGTSFFLGILGVFIILFLILTPSQKRILEEKPNLQ